MSAPLNDQFTPTNDLIAEITAWFQERRMARQLREAEERGYRQGLRDGRAWACGFASKRKLKTRG